MDSLGPCNNDFKDLILKMLHEKPNQRLSIREIKQHPWYKGETNTHKKSVIELNKALLADYTL